jgi:hypothetical protein
MVFGVVARPVEQLPGSLSGRSGARWEMAMLTGCETLEGGGGGSNLLGVTHGHGLGSLSREPGLEHLKGRMWAGWGVSRRCRASLSGLWRG